MSAWAFTSAYNEAHLIGYWVRHYKTFCERVIVYVDTDTNDGTEKIAASEGAEVRMWDSGSIGMDDIAFIDFANVQVLEARGQVDWAIWVDADEILYSRDMPRLLTQLTELGVTVPHLNYYVMVSDGLPYHYGQIYDDPRFRKGLFVELDGKIAIFNPREITICWEVGKHNATLTGNLKREADVEELKLLHYRWLGEDYLHHRDAQNYARASLRNLARRHGAHVYPEFVGPYNVLWSGQRPEDAMDVLR